MVARRALWALGVWFLAATVLPGGPPEAQAYTTGQKKEDPKEKKRKPLLDYQQMRRGRKVDRQMAEKREGIRRQIEDLLKFEKDPKEIPQLKFQLAENYFEEAQSFFDMGQELDEKLMKDPTNEKLRAEVAAEQAKLRKVEDEWRNKAIDMYMQLAKDYPDYPGRDQVLFYLGESLWDMKRQKEALTVHKELISTYPQSQYVPDAYLAFGDYYFDKAELDKALMAYKKVAEYKESQVYMYAIYKQGWCYYNLHEWDKAKESFQEVVHLSDLESASTGRKIDLRKEALNDFTLTYSHEGGAESAPRVFQRLAPKEAHDLLINLANMFFGDGKDKKAIVLYRWLIEQEKCSAEVPFYQGRVVDAASRVGEKRYTVSQVRRLLELFKEVEGCVKNPDARQKERIREAREMAELTLRKLSSIWYKEAKETQQKDTFEYAQELFGDYLDLFPESKDAYDMRFAYAELLFHRLGRYERAAVEYSKIVEEDLAYKKKNGKFPPKETDPKKRSAPGTYMCDSAFKAMQANRELLKKEKKADRKKRKEKKEEGKKDGAKPKQEAQPIPKNKLRFIRSAEIYMDHCPQDQDVGDVKYDIAKTYYDYYHLDEGIRRFDEIVRDFPKSDLAVYSANLVLDSLQEKEDFESLNTYARKYYKSPDLMANEKLRADLTRLIPEIAFKRVGNLEAMLANPPAGKPRLAEAKMHSKVAFAYIGFWREFPQHELADEALFNASVKYMQAERLDKARKARELLIEKFPESDLVPGTIFNLAENYERMADFDRAASLYERYAETYKKMKGLGKAVSYKERGKKPPPPPKGKDKKDKGKDAKKPEAKFEGNRRTWNLEDARDALLNAGVYREALRQFDKAVKDRNEFVDLFPDSDDAPKVFYSLGLMYERLGKLPQAAEIFKTYSTKYFKSNPDRAIAAHMKRAVLLRKAKKKVDWKEIDREVRETLKLYNLHKKKIKELPEAAEAAAHASFILAEPVYEDFIKYKFTLSGAGKKLEEGLKKMLAEKVKRFKKVETTYTDVAKLKQPEWAIASLYRIGRAYENFAETFYNAPLPKGLTPEQIDLYKGMLREQGQPFEDKAVAHFKAAVDKGSELGFYSDYSQKALEKLQHYRPAEFPREQLGFSLGLAAAPAFRNPLLLALWDDAKAKPELLNEPPLVTQRVGGEPVPAPAPEVKDREAPKDPDKGPPAGDQAKPGEPAKASGEAKPAEAAAKQPEPPKEPGDPASEAMQEDEPGDDEFE
ncbi:MAG TPA: tetratricopeptide repeat protein [Myxococcota bacterium]|nr:tetratricopeptide repeat protein [Myxococcota bacterium]HRY96275.1 tetratricopeptide repeat protein [Myxococcota bacterium]